MNIKDYTKVQKSCLVNKKVIETHCGRMVRAAKLLSLCLVRFLPTQQNEDRLQHNEIRSFWKPRFFNRTKGQIKPKADWRAADSPKKRTNKFVFVAFYSSRQKNTKFFGRIYGAQISFPFYLTFNTNKHRSNGF